MDDLIADTLADARWFPLRFDARQDAFHFAWVPADVHNAVAFLSTLQPTGDQRRVLPRAAVANAVVTEGPLHFILHSGFGGSTLLARALAQPGVVTTFKEPPILTDVIAFGLQAPAQQAAALCEQVTQLLSRPFGQVDAVVIKMSSIGNGLVAAMAANRPASRILCLRASLESMLASLARGGLEGRLNARKFLIGLRNSGFAELGYDASDLLEQSDLQLGALSWLAIQRMIQGAAARFGDERVRSITSDEFFDDSAAALTAISAHFRIDLDVKARLESGIFNRHAKNGMPFDNRERKERLAKTMEIYGPEIGPIVDWAKKVAEANHLDLSLPCPLFR